MFKFRYAFFDELIIDLDRALRVINGVTVAIRPNPSEQILEESMLNNIEKRHSISLMRINHVGEVCAQALYNAQGRFVCAKKIKQQLACARMEEEDHLAWTKERLNELGSHSSILTPFWYIISYIIGTIVAHMGDAKNLGFIAETERQVELHLMHHLTKFPIQDTKSRAIIQQMCYDEIKHCKMAESLGAADIPLLVRATMKIMLKIMTTVAYFL